MIVCMVFAMIAVYKSRLIIYEDRIVGIGIFSIRELKFNEIKGYAGHPYATVLVPHIKSKKKIEISGYLGGYKEIMLWLSETFPDLGKQQEMEEERVLRGQENASDWEAKLSKTRRIAKIINGTTLIVSAWAFAYPNPYQYSLMAAIAIPVIALLAVKFSGGLIRINGTKKKHSIYSSVVLSFIAPPMIIMMRALLDYRILNYSKAWPITIVLTLSLLFLLLIKQREFTFKTKSAYFVVPFVAVCLFAYSYGTIVHINCFYDDSEPQRFTAEVLSKRITSGDDTERYLKLSAWGEQTEANEINVRKKLYDRTEIGDTVSIHARKGKLGIPWFAVGK